VGVVRRSCNSTAVQRSGGLAEQKTRRARVWAARGVDRVQGVRPGAFKGGGAGDCEAQLRKGIPGSFAGDLGRAPVRGRKSCQVGPGRQREEAGTRASRAWEGA